MSKLKLVEYIWLDGTKPVCKIRSKSRVVQLPEFPTLKDFPEWSFDGSSTAQAVGQDSDCILKPACLVNDPLEDGGDYLLLCEVLNPDQSVHTSNTRAKLRAVLDAGGGEQDPWVGFEQEYTMFRKNIPLGWPEHGYPAPQGPYYCGVGPEQIFGRTLAMQHAEACMKANLIYYGLNAEVMPGQWEFQIGYRGVKNEDAGALNISDHTWIARWLLHRLSENHNIHISLDNKPVKGDWNGAGMHTNFSTKAMREAPTGRQAIDDAVEKLSAKHKEHIVHYGHGLEERLTGLHETSSIHEFSAGQSDRGRSIRIPKMVSLTGTGYLEDRRPGANSDPYLVAARLIATICGVEDKVLSNVA
jgi:glutamine synthetase